MTDRRFALVLGGGGMRGLAHVGALKALHECGWEPAEIAGTSIGALVGAAWATGVSVSEMEALAVSMRRRDLFDLAHADMAFKQLRAPAIYRAEPLEDLLRGLLGDITFRELPRRLIVAAVEINSGLQAFFGLPGLDHVRVADAVFASCALPGFFPPREIDGRWWMDGALVDNLPVRLAASRGVHAVVGVDVGASRVLRADTQEAGFAAIFARASEIVFQQANEWHLAQWPPGPPLLLVQPRVEHVPQFSFHHNEELVREGARATLEAIDLAGEAVLAGAPGIHPRRRMVLHVNAERCTGCGICLSTAPPGTFRMENGKAVPASAPVEWSPVDGGYVRQCPVWAITARPPGERPSTGGGSTGTAPGTAAP